jgi:hypothetical protein
MCFEIPDLPPRHAVEFLLIIVWVTGCASGGGEGGLDLLDTGEPPQPGPAYDLGTLLVLDPLRSPTGPRGWTRITLGNDRVVTIQSTALSLPPDVYRYRGIDDIGSWYSAVPLSGATAAGEHGHGEVWGARAEVRLGWNQDHQHRWALTFSIDTGLNEFSVVHMHCTPAGQRRLHCWWFGEGAAGPDQWPGDLALHPNSHFWWTRYDHPDEVPEPTRAQALELYLLGGLGQ